MGGRFDFGYINDSVVGSVGGVVVVSAEDGNLDSLDIALESND